MAEVQQRIAATPERVFDVLSDGWTYSDWVVGTTHVRAVDSSWPAVGSQLHHKSGPWPLSLHDRTEVLECEPGRRLVLRARLWPFGEAQVRLSLEPLPGGCRVTIGETFVSGPLGWLHNKANDLVLHGRNRESLRRLSDIVLGRSAAAKDVAAQS